MQEYLDKIDDLVKLLLFTPTRAQDSLNVVHDACFKAILDNDMVVSSSLKLPLCQDTGVVTLFVGHDCLTKGQIETIKNCFQAQFNLFARPSMLSSPFIEQHSLEDMQMCFLEELRDVRGIGAIISGAGTEMHSFLKVYPGTSDFSTVKKDILTWVKERGALACPPVHISIAMGGTAAEACKQSKMGFLFGSNMPQSFEDEYDELVTSIKGLEVDPLGKRGNWVGNVFLRVLPTHISAVPVSMSFMCWPFRAEWMEIAS
ncbi:fumarate hydratase [Coprothermobacter platensis]|uniref:fumarate hydratase n=1 Tax=Coprothermobacter platensis TaxID=108819 RepID=UPI0003A79692|nr:fumarate hydratase [Coprothermobacter platensis]